MRLTIRTRRRRQRREIACLFIFFVCLGTTVVATTDFTISANKRPPPPPPPPPKRQLMDSSSKQENVMSQTKAPDDDSIHPTRLLQQINAQENQRTKVPPPPKRPPPPSTSMQSKNSSSSISSEKTSNPLPKIPPPPPRRPLKQQDDKKQTENMRLDYRQEEERPEVDRELPRVEKNADGESVTTKPLSTAAEDVSADDDSEMTQMDALSSIESMRLEVEIETSVEKQSLRPPTVAEKKNTYLVPPIELAQDEKASTDDKESERKPSWDSAGDVTETQPVKTSTLQPEMEMPMRSPPSMIMGTSLENDEIAKKPSESQRPQPRQQEARSFTTREYRPAQQTIPLQHHGQNHYHPNQQYQRPPPNQNRGQYGQYSAGRQQQRVQQGQSAAMGSTAKSLFKSFLGNMERGLDELTNIEENISKRAQRLVSSAASAASSAPSMRLFVSSPSTSKDQPQKQSYPRQPMRQTSPATNTQQNSAPTSSDPPTNSSPFAHLGQKYKVAQAQKQSTTPEVTRKLNGGASAPYGQTPDPPRGASSPTGSDGQVATPPQQQRQPYQQVQPPQQTRPVDQGQTSTGPGSSHQASQTTSFGANPYVQSSNLQRQPQQKTADPHSRESRLPWDTSSTKRPKPMYKPSPARKYDDDEKVSWGERLSKFLPRVRLPNPAKILRFKKDKSYDYASMEAWKDTDEDTRSGFFGLFRGKKSKDVFPKSIAAQSSSSSGETMAPPLVNLMTRSDNGKTTSLLSPSDRKKCRSIGRYHATFDVSFVMFLILGMQQMPGLESLSIATSFAEFSSKTLPHLATILRNSLDTWSPFWFAYAYLTMVTRNIFLGPKVTELATSVASTVEDDSLYAQLYLRLVAALPMDSKLPARLSEAAVSQITSLVSSSRLNSFVTLVLSLLVVMTVSVLRPAMLAIGTSIFKLATLNEWRSWPIDWGSLIGQYRTVLRSLYLSLETLIANGLSSLFDSPMNVAAHLSIFASLLLATLIPRIEGKRKIVIADEDDDDEAEFSFESAELLSKLGASSASRLTMLSENGSVENALERWRLSQVSAAEDIPDAPISSWIRLAGYSILAGITTLAPILVSFFVSGASTKVLEHTGLQWDSLLDVSVILLFVFFLVRDSLKNLVLSSSTLPTAKAFLSVLSKTLEEIKQSNKQQADIKFMASVSPSAGLAVRDLWAAHTSKRAWAVRGANLQCRSGEILAVLGDDGSGKTRMLTTIAESLVLPPKRSLTSNKVRGLIAVCGLDASKWDRWLLKRRLGILLSDVRTVSDTATLFSGWTMEEILEPVDGIRPPSHTLSASDKAAIVLGLKITGLYSTLIPKLPSKLSTVITANEEELQPSSLRSTVLSPAEWSKLILSKVLAQTISDNDNAAASTDKVENSLMGSVLLLDDATVLLSEVEEAKLLRELRQTGAATVLTSNKWATGRFVDKIVVVKNGAIVESGTHNELIARGPQQSLYAAKWHAMTMN